MTRITVSANTIILREPLKPRSRPWLVGNSLTEKGCPRASSRGRRRLELPVLALLAERVHAAHLAVAAVGIDGHIAAFQRAFGEALLRGQLARERGLGRLPFHGLAVGRCVQRAHRERPEDLELVLAQPRHRGVLEEAVVHRPGGRDEKNRGDRGCNAVPCHGDAPFFRPGRIITSGSALLCHTRASPCVFSNARSSAWCWAPACRRSTPGRRLPSIRCCTTGSTSGSERLSPG